MNDALDGQGFAILKELFKEALLLPSDDRAAFLQEACRGDETLRESLERLLVADSDLGFMGYQLLWYFLNVRAESLWKETAKAGAILAREAAAEKAALFRKRLEQIKRLSDTQWLSKLEEEAETLWHACPEKVAPMEAWIASAEEIIGRTELHRSTCLELRERALPLYDEDAEQRSRESHPKWKTLMKEKVFRENTLERIEELKEKTANAPDPGEAVKDESYYCNRLENTRERTPATMPEE